MKRGLRTQLYLVKTVWRAKKLSLFAQKLRLVAFS